MKQYALLLAGGSGTRLWPLSRKNVPKQFIALPNKKTLLETTLDRIEPLSGLHKVIITTQQYASLAQNVARKYSAQCLVEPESRNTAPAIAWSIRELQKHNHDDATVIIMPTDHIITNEHAFQEALTYAAHYATTHDALILCGSPQKFVTTRFGFVSYNPQKILTQESRFSLHAIEKFHEKPTLAEATLYKQQENTVWNMGIFVARISVLQQLFMNYAPYIMSNLDDYGLIPSQSFDHAIVEKSTKDLALLSYDFGWNDVGSLDSFIPAIHDSSKNSIEIVGAHSNSVVAHKSVVLAGVTDLVVIEMDDMIFIAQRDIAQSPELIAQHMNRLGLEDLL